MRASTIYRPIPFIILLLLLAGGALTAQWSALPSIARYRLAAQYAAIDSTLYIFGGYGPGGSTAFQKDAFKLDLRSAAAWEPIADLPEARFAGYAAAYNGKAYIVGGLVSNSSSDPDAPTIYSTDVLEYDPATNAYTKKSTIPTPWDEGAAVTIGSRIYLLAGRSESHGVIDSMTTQVYDMATNSWSRATSAPRAVQGASAAAVGSNIYMVGGLGENGIIDVVNKGAVDGGTIAWSTVAHYPVRAQLTAAGTLYGKVYVTAGVSPDDPDGKLDNTYSYDEATGAWSEAEKLPVATHSNPLLLESGGALYFIGSSQSTKVFRYTAGVTGGGLMLSQSRYVLALQKGEEKSLEMTVTNTTGASITAAVDPGAASWLSATPATLTIPAGGSAPLAIVVKTGGMEAGAYKGTVTLTIGAASLPVQVRLWVLESIPSQPMNVALEYTASTELSQSIAAHDTARAIEARHPGRVIRLVYHGYTGDTLGTSEGDTLLARLSKPFLVSFPTGAIGRRIISGAIDLKMTFVTEWGATVDSALAKTPNARFALAAPGAAYDPAAKRVTATVTIAPTLPIETVSSVSYRLTAVVVEDSVAATQKATGGEALSSYLQPRVVRALWPDAAGKPIAFTSPALDDGFLAPGAVTTESVSIDASRVAHPERARLVLLLHADVSGEPGEIMQAIDVPIATQSSGVAVAGDATTQGMLAIYPNPGAGIVRVHLATRQKGHARLSLIDERGALVAIVFDDEVEAGERMVPIDMSGYASGVYLLRLEGDGDGKMGVIVVRR